MKRMTLACIALACGGDVGAPLDASVEADATMAFDAAPDAPVYTCTVEDAGLNAAYFSDASPDCPAQWAELTHDGGLPNACTKEGLLCVYAEGQAVCAQYGTAGLRWGVVGNGTGCSPLPPTQCTPCSLAYGSVCQYVNGPPVFPGFTVNFCCDGNVHAWDLVPDGGCPNGNVCGTIHAADYDQSCTTASDCARVTEGDLCTMVCTDCINAVVSTKALAQYQSDFANKLSVPRDCPCPSGPTAICDAGRCTF